MQKTLKVGFIGFGIKAGFVPFHNWLPDAHPKAPSHVSAMMSGVMIKTGIYGIVRALEICSIPKIETIYFIVIISIITALYGITYASVQKDIKKLQKILEKSKFTLVTTPFVEVDEQKILDI